MAPHSPPSTDRHLLPEAGAGVRDTDTVIYASVSDEGCEGGTYAYASSCLLAEGDSRPVAGYINLCEALWVRAYDDMHYTTVLNDEITTVSL